MTTDPIHSNSHLVQFCCALFGKFSSRKREFQVSRKNRLTLKSPYPFMELHHRCQGIKPESLNQIFYCKDHKVVHMYVLEDDADKMLPYFLHRVRRIENKTRN